MRIIEARKLKTGMELEAGGMVVSVIIIDADRVELEFSVYDPDCGEFDYVSFEEDANELYTVL